MCAASCCFPRPSVPAAVSWTSSGHLSEPAAAGCCSIAVRGAVQWTSVGTCCCRLLFHCCQRSSPVDICRNLLLPAAVPFLSEEQSSGHLLEPAAAGCCSIAVRGAVQWTSVGTCCCRLLSHGCQRISPVDICRYLQLSHGCQRISPVDICRYLQLSHGCQRSSPADICRYLQLSAAVSSLPEEQSSGHLSVPAAAGCCLISTRGAVQWTSVGTCSCRLLSHLY